MKTREEKPSWIYGVHSVRAVISRRPAEVVEVLAAPERIEFAEVARSKKLSVRELSAHEIGRLCGSDSAQGIAVRAPLPAPAELEELAERPPHLLIALDGVTDPQNLGAIARSAEALGASGIVVPKDRAAGLSASAHKASAGALEFLPVAIVTNLARSLRQLKEQGYWVYATAPDSGSALEQVDFNDKIVLIIGAEDRGARPGVEKEADYKIRISQKGRTQSLNASVACAIIIHQIMIRKALGPSSPD